MSREQRIFRGRHGFTTLVIAVVALPAGFLDAAERVLIAEDKISIELADGWSETDLNAGDVIAGYATQDRKNSMFINRFQAGGSMMEIIEGTVRNFEERFEITSEDKATTGQVSGPGEKKWPAVFKLLEADVKKGNDLFPMKFYLLVFDTGTELYSLQASSLMPVRGARERQIFEMIRSIVAKP